MSNEYSLKYDELDEQNFDDVSGDWIQLENAVMNSNSKIIGEIFGVETEENGNDDSNTKLLTLSEQIKMMSSIKDSALTNDELNQSNMYVYKFNVVYLVFKIFLFLMFIYVVYKILKSNDVTSSSASLATLSFASNIKNLMSSKSGNGNSANTNNVKIQNK